MHHQVKYLNIIIDAHHSKPKQSIGPVRGFKTLKTACATIKDFEMMRALHKLQASTFNITCDTVDTLAFSNAPSVLDEVVQLFGEQFGQQTHFLRLYS